MTDLNKIKLDLIKGYTLDYYDQNNLDIYSIDRKKDAKFELIVVIARIAMSMSNIRQMHIAKYLNISPSSVYSFKTSKHHLDDDVDKIVENIKKGTKHSGNVEIFKTRSQAHKEGQQRIFRAVTAKPKNDELINIPCFKHEIVRQKMTVAQAKEKYGICYI